ncbi:MAG: carboxylating nicotinate-nucleotide diphosphorylase [candidate division KSB1 bacterium]|nr:carboxylating nicotinate-nucleotide diphosphorylase [candidate division KSB1 bacterium]
MLSREEVLPLIQAALAEDLGDRGDITTQAVVPDTAVGRARIQAKAQGILAGIAVAEWVFVEVDPQLQFVAHRKDGDRLCPGDTLAEVQGRLRSILTGERVALNFLTRLSGIATWTSQFVAAVAGTSARILDTRKTTPGWRRLEKYAVRCGGGQNHRMGLYDQVLVKDNHIAAAGSVTEAVRRVRRWLEAQGLRTIIEIEVTNLDQLAEAMAAGVDRVLLDNMPLEMMRQAVGIGKGRVEFEASGNITLANVRQVAETGVDYISIGALTHSAPALDISLEVEAA